MSLEELTLGSICDQGGGVIRTGPFGSQLHESDYSNIGTPVVMPKDIIQGKVSEQSIARVSDEHVNRLSQHKLLPGDIVYGRRGDIGRQALIRERESGWLCGTGCLRITLGTGPVDPKWLHYYLRDQRVVAFIAQQAVGATMPNLNTSILRSIPIRFPSSLETQRRIASILSTYDDLIENNTRRIAILEEMARRIYEEWFVHFRFPGHEQLKMVESELGLIPEGWSWQSLRDVAVDVREGVNPDSIAPTTPYVGLEHIPRRSIGLSEWGGASEVQSTKLRFQPGDILFGKIRPYFHKVAVAPISGVASSDAIVIRAKESKWYFLALATVSSDAFVAEATQSSNGTKMPRANWNVLLGYKVPQPTEQVLERFNKVMSGIVDFIRIATLKNRNLRATRDLLLPKLISGELDISNLPTPEEVSAA